jgi:lysophospholipase L1-like esterase
LTWPGLIARADSPRVLFVFVGTNGTATAAEQAAAVAQECVGRRCMVTLQGVRPAYDAAMAAVPGVEVCDMSALSIFRPDGVHPDKAGSWHLAQRINECRRDLLAALPTAEAAP